MTEYDLLIAYQHSRSHELFSQIVQRYIDMVYSIAHRLTGDPHLAQDISQEVFLTFLRKARSLNPRTPIEGWFFVTTRWVSMRMLRARARRRRHESEVAMSHDASISPDVAWSLIARDVDAAVARLPPDQRDLIVLRYFAGKSHQEIASTLSISTEAASKRIQRAVDSLRQFLSTRGTVLPAESFSAALVLAKATAAPPTLGAAIAHSAASIATSTFLKGALMASLKAKIAASVVAAAVLIPATVMVIKLAAQGSPSAPATVAAPTSPPAAAADPIDEFDRIYRLEPGQALALIAPPFPDCRAAGYQYINHSQMNGQDSLGSHTPSFMKISWSEGTGGIIRAASWGSDNYRPVLATLTSCLELPVFAIEGDQKVLMSALPGDLILRKGASDEQIRAALEKLVSQKLGADVSLTFQMVDRPTYVLRGTWDYKPIVNPDAPPAPNPGVPMVYLYAASTFDPKAPQEANGSNSGSALANVLQEWIQKPVLVEAQDLPPMFSYGCMGTRNPLLMLTTHDPAPILAHLAEQTGLHATLESRPMRILKVTTSKQNP
jgi:RNA polymerase sigma factor (sigma-70 family)